MNIPITPDVERVLTEAARRQGTTPELLALACLRERFLSNGGTENPAAGAGNLADFLAGHLGVLSSGEHVRGGARLSEDCGKKFAAGMARKRDQGRL